MIVRFRKCKIREFLMTSLIFMIIAVLYVLLGHQLMVNYQFSDINFHVNRLLGLSGIWHHPINYTTYAQTGYGVNYFYPWLTAYPVVLCMKLMRSFVKGYYIFVILVNYVTGLSAYYAGKQITSDRLKSFVFSYLWIFSTYRSLDIYRRFDVGEYLAMIFIPLVFSALWLILIRNKNAWLQLAFVVTLILYSHILSACMTVFACGIFLILCWNLVVDKRTVIIRLLKAMALSVGLGMGYILPYIQQARLKMTTPALGNMQATAYAVKRLVVTTFANTLGNLQDTTVGLGIVCVIFLVLGIFFLRKVRFAWIWWSMGLLFSIMVTKLFPWMIFPKWVGILQFPTRFVIFSTFFSLIFGSIIFIRGKLWWRWLMTVGLLLLTTVSFNIRVHNLSQTAPVQEKIALEAHGINSRFMYANYPEYRSIKSISGNNLNTIVNHVFLDNDGKQIPVTYQTTSAYYVVNLQDKVNEREIDMPIEFYKGIYAHQGKRILPVSQSSRGTVIVHGVDGDKRQIVVSSKWTFLALIGWAITLISLICSLIIFLRKYFPLGRDLIGL